MALIANISNNHRTYVNAYIRASILSSDKQLTSILCEVWENLESRSTHPTPLFSIAYAYNTIDITSINPLDYGYRLLLANDAFSDAVYNINI